VDFCAFTGINQILQKKIKDVEVKIKMTVITDHRDFMKVPNVTIMMLIKRVTEAYTQM